MAERKTVAQELAVKDGHDWETLSAEQVSAYLHNADLVIEERSRAPVDEFDPKPVYSCDRCQDKAYIGGKPCSECNPVGLPAEEVHPQIESQPLAIEGEEDIQEIANKLYQLQQPHGDDLTEQEKAKAEAKAEAEAQAKKEAEEAVAKAKAEREAEEVRRTRELKPSEYRCSKCSKVGKTVIHMLKKDGKGIGNKHKEFAIGGRLKNGT